MKITTEICDVCSHPSKEGQLFELKISGRINSELKEEELKKFVKDEKKVRSFFMMSFDTDYDDPHNKRKVVSFNSEICEKCASKIITSIINHRMSKEKEITSIEKMFTKKEEV